MINLILLLVLILAIIWSAKKLYGPIQIAQHPDRYPPAPDLKGSKKEIAIILSYAQRWRQEGKISREEYDRLTDICLSEIEEISRGETHV